MYKVLFEFTIPPLQKVLTPSAEIQHVGTAGISWSAFNELVQQERDACVAGEKPKVLYLLRHGHGEHNAIPDNPLPHWTLMKGFHKTDSIDPTLSQIGEEQMSHIAIQIQEGLKNGLVPPTKVFASIAKRTCQSAVESWGTVLESQVPIVAMQDLRDNLNNHGMERRVPLKEIKQLFPSVTIQEGTTEEDDLWVKQNGFETEEEWQGRMERAFYDIWAQSGEHESVAIVAHRHTFSGIWARVLKESLREYQPGEMRVVIIKHSDDAKI